MVAIVGTESVRRRNVPRLDHLRLRRVRPQHEIPCPQCQRWIRKLYEIAAGEWVCRPCSGLDRLSRHEHRCSPARLAVHLRRQLGLSGELGAPLPTPRTPHQRRLVREALIAEARAFAYAEALIASYEKAKGRPKRKRR